MKNKLNLFLLILVLWVASISGLAQELKITIPFTVIDGTANFLDNLQPSDIQAKQGKKILTINSLEQTKNQPLDVVLLLDASSSMYSVFPMNKRVAQSFIDSNLNKDKDRVAVIKITGETKIYQSLTNDFAAANKSIEQLEALPPQPIVVVDRTIGNTGNRDNKKTPNVNIQVVTSLYDSLKNVSENFFLNEKNDSRKVIILFSDGYDSFSDSKMRAVIETDLKANVLIYAIGIGDEGVGVDKKSLKEITEMSGGKAFFPKMKDDLLLIFNEIEQSLRSNYTLTFTPPEAQSTDKLNETKIEIVNPKLRKRKLQIFQTKGYFSK